MTKDPRSASAARTSGADQTQLSDTVKVTLGPKGRNVVQSKAFGGAPVITKAGVLIAREVELDDPYEKLGAQLVESVATTTYDVGDGTTTATVLAQALVNAGLKNVAAGAQPDGLKRGIDAAVEAISQALDAVARPVEGEREIAEVATIYAQDAAIGELIGEAFTKVGKNGVITVGESNTTTTELEFTEGVQFGRGYISPYFVTDPEAREAVLEDAYVLITTQKVSSIADVLPLLEKVVETKKPLVVIAEDVDGEVLSTLVVNAIRKTFTTVAVKAPFPLFGDLRKAFLQDLAIITGGQVVAPEFSIKLGQAGLDVLGVAGRVTVTKDTTTITHGAGAKADIDDRIAQIQREIEDTDHEWDREKLQERLAMLSAGVGVVRVGAATEAELQERKHRIKDAISATRAAIEQGIVAGDGTALVRAASAVDSLSLTGDEATGAAIVRKAVAEPLRWIAANAGLDGYVVVAKVAELSGNEGLNAATGEYVDLVEAGVVDPVKVTKAALATAASVAGIVLSTQESSSAPTTGGPVDLVRAAAGDPDPLIAARAAKELAELRLLRAAVQASDHGRTQAHIAKKLNVSQPAVHKMLTRARTMPEVADETPWEVVLRYAAGELDRDDMVLTLTGWNFTAGTFMDADAALPEQYQRGNWSDITRAVAEGYLTEQDYEVLFSMAGTLGGQAT